MEREMEYLLRLLKGFLWGEKGEADEGVDWARLMELAQIHSVSGILGYMAMTAPIAPENLRAELRQNCLQTMSLYNRRFSLAQERLEAMARMGVDSCTMKGMVLRVHYPVPELRTFNDVDILIHEAQRETVHAHLLGQGFACDVDYGNVYCYRRGPEYYEVHSHLVSKEIKEGTDACAFFDGVWEHAVETAPHIWEMDREFHLVYLLYHIAKHVAGYGAGVRMYLDVAVWLKAYDGVLDWPRAFAWLEALNLTQFGISVLSAAESWFAAPCRASFERLRPETLARYAQFTLEAGTFGHHGRDNALAVLKQNEGSRLGMLRRRIFPSAKSMENRYSYLKGRHYLVPVAWMQRMVEFKGGTPKQFAREARDIMTMDAGEAQRLKDICKEIGL